MSNNADSDKKPSTLSLTGKTLSLKAPAANAAAAGGGQIKQSFSGGRTKTVAVEVRRQRSNAPEKDNDGPRQLTDGEREARARALKEALINKENAPKKISHDPADIGPAAMEPVKTARQQEIEELERIRAVEKEQATTIEKTRQDANQKRQEAVSKIAITQNRTSKVVRTDGEDEDSPSARERMKRVAERKLIAPRVREGEDKPARLTVTQVLNNDYERDRGPSLAAVKRARQKNRNKMMGDDDTKKQIRDVILPEHITVQELANRMAERSGNVIKSLMKMGVMATITQNIDADTAELIILEFGHKVKRVTEGDIETGIEGETDTDENLEPRPPVVTIMGHVDHGKTSLLDALRQTNVVAGEAGGITQHIGAYQITNAKGQRITFLDTPGHAAFSEMRARGANITDIVVLVVAANDGIMPQTIEALRHAKAAGVPMIVAINKVDLPDANPMRVKQDLLQHEIIVEDLGGETLVVEVSAKKRLGLDKLEEAILLQAEILNLRANPNRQAAGTVIESKVETGRGSVATVLVKKGTLALGDIFVIGAEYGKVRALINDQGKQIKTAIPGQPVEIIGLTGTPDAGDEFAVVETEAKARDIAEYRARKRREGLSSTLTRGEAMEQMFAVAKDGNRTTLSVIIKADVHGSVEAIAGTMKKIVDDNTDLAIQVLHTGVGAITETDVSLAAASKALIIGFNVRANTQARELANKNGTDIRYYSIIYNVIDDVKAVMSGMLMPTIREEFIGNASIRQVFNITKVGKVSGCMVTQGFVKRGAKVRLLRDNVVIHEGKLKTLKRFKDEVKEVKEGMECGMAFENYDDMREGDVIECFDIVSEARSVS